MKLKCSVKDFNMDNNIKLLLSGVNRGIYYKEKILFLYNKCCLINEHIHLKFEHFPYLSKIINFDIILF